MTAAAAELLDVKTLDDDELVATLWRAGDLSWLLQPHQLLVYDDVLAWAANPPRVEGALYDRVAVLDIGRRWGKTALCLLILYQLGIRNPGWSMIYATREKDQIKRIVIPLHRMLTQSAPDDVRPRYSDGKQGMPEGMYFQNGTIIRLVGVDKDPDRLRGEGCDWAVFSEAAHMKDLQSNMGIFMPQLQKRRHARVLFESTAPWDLDHDFDKVFVPDAKMRGAYWFGTIDDNTSLSDEEKEEALREAGGRDSPNAQVEYFGKRIRDPKRTIIPEFDADKHVQAWPVPAYAHCYVSADPGTRDLFAILWAYWDFGRAALYFQREWTATNALTFDAATAMRIGEQELWGAPEPAGEPRDRFALPGTRKAGSGPDVEVTTAWHPAVGAPEGVLPYYDGKMLQANPYERVSDIELRLCADLSRDYGLLIEPVRKLHTREAMASSFRDALRLGQIIVSPDCPQLIDHLTYGRWNERRTEWDRTTAYGHFDLIAAAIYMWLKVKENRHLNPNAPYRPAERPGVQIQDRLPWQKAPELRQLEVVRHALGQDSNVRPGRMRISRR